MKGPDFLHADLAGFLVVEKLGFTGCAGGALGERKECQKNQAFHDGLHKKD